MDYSVHEKVVSGYDTTWLEQFKRMTSCDDLWTKREKISELLVY